MNHYIHFTFECFSKFINYISQDFNVENEDDKPIISKEMSIYICNHLLFFRNITRIYTTENEFKLTFEKANQKIINMLIPSLQQYTPILSMDAYNEIIGCLNGLNEKLKTQSIEYIIPHIETNCPVDHGFHYDYQNTITQSILWCLNCITKWLDFTMIEIKDVYFVSNCLLPNHKEIDNFILNEEEKNKLQPIIDNILIKHDLYITSEASDELCKLWLQLNNQKLSMRMICFDQPIN
jgi:hypothetical protein